MTSAEVVADDLTQLQAGNISFSCMWKMAILALRRKWHVDDGLTEAFLAGMRRRMTRV